MTAFTGARLDRAGDGRRRDAGWLAAQVDDPGARAVRAGSDGVWLTGDRLDLAPLGTAAEPLLLGLDADGPVFAVDVDPAPTEGVAPLVAAGGRRGDGAHAPAAADGPRPVGLREAVTVLAQAESGLVAYAAALVNWHRRHRFCAACGAPTGVAEGGLVRLCPVCATSHHPRTDPVAIMLVTDRDRLLLGRAPRWPPRRYSALAGFVEPGESLEEAVVREVREESGVDVGPPRYVTSQPWPFPASLMIGFEAPYLGGAVSAQEEELQDVRWFSREELRAAAALDVDGWGGEPGEVPGDGLLLPPTLAIARRLIDRWLAGGSAPG